jgi:hypothetical protein
VHDGQVESQLVALGQQGVVDASGGIALVENLSGDRLGMASGSPFEQVDHVVGARNACLHLESSLSDSTGRPWPATRWSSSVQAGS